MRVLKFMSHQLANVGHQQYTTNQPIQMEQSGQDCCFRTYILNPIFTCVSAICSIAYSCFNSLLEYTKNEQADKQLIKKPSHIASDPLFKLPENYTTISTSRLEQTQFNTFLTAISGTIKPELHSTLQEFLRSTIQVLSNAELLLDGSRPNEDVKTTQKSLGYRCTGEALEFMIKIDTSIIASLMNTKNQHLPKTATDDWALMDGNEDESEREKSIYTYKLVIKLAELNSHGENSSAHPDSETNDLVHKSPLADGLRLFPVDNSMPSSNMTAPAGATGATHSSSSSSTSSSSSSSAAPSSSSSSSTSSPSSSSSTLSSSSSSAAPSHSISSSAFSSSLDSGEDSLEWF